MRKETWALVGLITAMAAIDAGAVGKVTVDPNVPGARIAAVAPEIDSRLDRKITYEARRKTVSAILAELSELTGITLRAGYNNEDWQVRDRRMNIFAEGVPLKSLMDSIAHVMKFKWSKSDQGGTWAYRLYMDRKTLLGAERQRLIEEERLGELEVEQRERVLDGLTKAAAMSDEELEKLKNDDPLMYVQVKIGWSALMPGLFAQVPGAKDAWSAGDYLTLNGRDLPPEAQQALLKTLGMMATDLTKTIGPEAAPSEEAFRDLSKVDIAINEARKLMGYRGDTYIGDVTVKWPGGYGGLQTAFINPDSPVAKEVGRAYLRILESGPVGQSEQSKMNREHLIAIEEQKTDYGEPVIEHPDDPALSVKVKIKPKDDRFVDLLAAVGTASGYAIVSDSFVVAYRGFDLANSEVPLKDVLNKIASQYRYNWEKRGAVLEFRDRDWFRKRASQVPEAWLEPWRKSLDKTGTLNIYQLSQMALLDDDQVRENLYADDVGFPPGLSYVLFLYGDLLRAYKSLDTGQQAAVFTEEGFDLGAVSPAQWPTVAKMFRSKPMLAASTDAGLRLMGKREQVGKLTKYSFTARASTADSPPAKWEFTTPKYDLAYKISVLPWTGAGSRGLDLFAEARKAKLSDRDAWFKLGMVLYDGRYYPQSLEAFEQSSTLAKNAGTDGFLALTWKGHLLDVMNRREEAIAAYKEALKIDIGSASMRQDQYDLVIDRKWVEQRLKTPFERK